jgi:hypothetical protein
MKKLFLSISLVASAFFAKAQDATVVAPDPNAPIIKWDQTTVDYGEIQQGADGYREFTFTNTGKTPLKINSAQGSCGCTVPTWPKEDILPGQKGSIKVHYDTNRIGGFTKTVTVNSNAQSASDVLRIQGTVNAIPVEPTPEPVIEIQPPVISLPDPVIQVAPEVTTPEATTPAPVKKKGKTKK